MADVNPTGVKRPIEDDPKMEPPTKAAKSTSRLPPATTRPPVDETGKAQSGVLTHASAGLSGPHTMVSSQTLIIDSNGFAAIFGLVHMALINLLYPDGRYNAAGVISQANFVLVCRYLLVARLHAVYSSCTGRRKDGRIAVPRDYRLPKSIAHIINSVGQVFVRNKGVHVIPEPENRAADIAVRLENTVTHVMLNSFSRLIMACEHRGFITTEYISNVPDGSAWWMLSPRDASDLQILCVGNTDRVRVIAAFPEFTPSDAILAAIVQRNFDGNIAGVLETNQWEFDPISGVSGIAVAFATAS